jgi:site-specific DNA recombinase
MERAKGGSIRRCAVYTRKSSDEGLEQDFNSLHAQREACEAFIKSQASEGWRLIRTAYDDGGFSGGNIERPALQQLLSDIREKLVDVVVVYKVDRLTRSLTDFAQLVEQFEAHGVSFVAVTQQFNTTTSMGRLTLNVLLSFAQFERELTGERIRDKIVASKRKGLWMGGVAPLGYEVRERKLVVNESEAQRVRYIYRRYLELKSVRLLKEHLDQHGLHSRAQIRKSGPHGGGSFSRGALYQMLANPIYIGEIRHKHERHPGQHQPIVEREVWERVQRLLKARAVRRGSASVPSVNLLAGKLFNEHGEPLYVSGASKRGRRYRYYVSRELAKGTAGKVNDGWRLAAPELERVVIAALSRILGDKILTGEALHRAGASAAEIATALKDVGARSESIATADAAKPTTITLLKRVDLGRDCLRLSLDLEPLIAPGTKLADSATLKITRTVPMHLKRRGVETRLVLAGGTDEGRERDPALLKALVRGYRWFRELASGTAADASEIAKREGVDDSYVRRLLPLALLAPELVEAVCDGRQPLDLSAEALARRADLSLDWHEQQQLLSSAR